MEFPLQSHRYKMEKYAVVAFQMSSFLWVLTFCCRVDYKHLGLIVLYYVLGMGECLQLGLWRSWQVSFLDSSHPCRGLVVYVLISSKYAVLVDQWYLTTHVLISLKCVQVGTQGAKR